MQLHFEEQLPCDVEGRRARAGLPAEPLGMCFHPGALSLCSVSLTLRRV